MSSTARAQFWLMLPTRMISPLRTYQTVPLTSRSRVTRSVTASTVPVASPTSTTSPMPYWSSKSMKRPDRKSETSDWAPKPSATPTMPAPAMSGPMLTSNSESTMTPAMAKIAKEATERSTWPRVSARCLRRSRATRAVRCALSSASASVP